MDLKQYKLKIKNQLLQDLNNQAHVSKIKETTGKYISGGGALPDNKVHAEHVYLGNNYGVGKTPKHVVNKINNIYKDIPDNNKSYNIQTPLKQVQRLTKQSKVNMANGYAEEGGYIPHNIESVNHDEFNGGKFNFLKSFKKVGDGVKTMATIAKGAKDIYNVGKSIASTMKTVEPMAEEAMPLAEVAAGMKKPRKKRQVSEKETRRHNLIKKLMKEHGLTLAEASKHIKQNNLSY
jgi:hypothetical protein